jgi:hypothetical protein|nr:MAG: hypothetical protein J07AB56_07040 [Candidatus Nanosalinarum sp. J07AB56]
MSGEDEVIFEAGQNEESRDRPMFSSDVAAAWIDEDQNGDYFLRVSVDLGILGRHRLQLFADDDHKSAFNEFVEHTRETQD